MPEVTYVQAIWTTLAVFFTLCIFSFLYKDNPLYKIAEHVVVGVSNGYWMILLFRDTFKPLWLDPTVALVTGKGLSAELTIFVIANLILSIFMLFRLVGGNLALLSRWAMAVVLGVSAGVLIPLSVQTYMYEQLKGNVLTFGAFPFPFVSVVSQTAFNNLLIITGSLSGLAYFFFSKEHKGFFGGTAKLGIWFLMIGFGATFGYTVMGRLSLLIGRIEFLRDWLGMIF
ncbi:MAG: hypothetical protein L0Z48_08410 [candidate division Zixibacteria bacterium]|nr:hypothetical protein [candidate division Zixibacteria bacterium]MCI0596550.1 hypothetical protein [candidate division Zixibacteria bacterium]